MRLASDRLSACHDAAVPGCEQSSLGAGRVPTRRQALTVALSGFAVLSGTTGCRLRLESEPPAAPTPPPTADELVRDVVAGQANRLLALTASVRGSGPAAQRTLALLAAHHRAHARALRPVPTSTPVGTPTPTRVPGRADLRDLADAERAASGAALTPLAKVSPETARLLASVAAARQVHVDLLAGAGQGIAPVTAPRSSTGLLAVAELTAITAALSGERAAVYAYGIVGAQAGARYRQLSLERLAFHGRQRDLLAGRLTAAGAEPLAVAPAYALPFRVIGVTGARRLAAHVEASLAAAYADLVAAASKPSRRAAADQLAQCALQARRWGATARAFPGLPERG